MVAGGRTLVAQKLRMISVSDAMCPRLGAICLTMDRPRKEPQLFRHERDEIEIDREARSRQKLYVSLIPEEASLS